MKKPAAVAAETKVKKRKLKETLRMLKLMKKPAAVAATENSAVAEAPSQSRKLQSIKACAEEALNYIQTACKHDDCCIDGLECIRLELERILLIIKGPWLPTVVEGMAPSQGCKVSRPVGASPGDEAVEAHWMYQQLSGEVDELVADNERFQLEVFNLKREVADANRAIIQKDALLDNLLDQRCGWCGITTSVKETPPA